jgi:hypothetical protein
MKKTVYTLCVDGYAPGITELTFPLMKRYAYKIGAEFHVITERRFPDWPVTYEKLQIYELGQEAGNDWNIFFDADTLVNPMMMDITEHMSKDTVMHNAVDCASNRWTYDRFFRRDGRHVSSCNWFAIASDWCIELWKPLDDLTLAQALSNINPIPQEEMGGIHAEHLIDDYTLSRNIAKYGFKLLTFTKLREQLGHAQAPYLWHTYNVPEDIKRQQMLGVLSRRPDGDPPGWGIMRLNGERSKTAVEVVAQ